MLTRHRESMKQTASLGRVNRSLRAASNCRGLRNLAHDPARGSQGGAHIRQTCATARMLEVRPRPYHAAPASWPMNLLVFGGQPGRRAFNQPMWCRPRIGAAASGICGASAVSQAGAARGYRTGRAAFAALGLRARVEPSFAGLCRAGLAEGAASDLPSGASSVGGTSSSGGPRSMSAGLRLARKRQTANARASVEAGAHS